MTEIVSRSDADRRLIEAGMVLVSELALDTVLRRIVELAVELTGARYGALGVLTPDGRRIEEFITVGVTDEERAAIGDPPVGHGLLGALITEARPMRLPDIAADPRSVGFPPNHPPMRSLLGAPVAGRGRVFGNIYLTEKQGATAFDDEDERVLLVLATQAAVAVENARLYAETERTAAALRRLEMMDERERIAKELHDGVIQSLFAVGMSLQGLASMSPDPETARRLESAVEDVDHAIRDLRNYIFGLRPGVLADRQLDQALQQLGEEFADRTRRRHRGGDQRAGGIRARVSRRGRRADRPGGPVQRRPPRGGDDLSRPVAARSRGAGDPGDRRRREAGSIRRCPQRGWVCPTFASAPPRSAERSRSRARRARAPRCGSRSRAERVLTSRASPE